jgi:hypothetical protein
MIILLATLPVVVPFLTPADPNIAVRISNGVALTELFLLGMWWGRMVGGSPLRVAAGLTLLLSTSFLGLRRDLRQRRLEMPVEMTATWVGVGLILIAATLLVCALLPRPDGVWELAKLPIEFTSPDNQANRVAAGPEGAQEDPNRPSNSAADAQKGQQTEREGPGEPQKGKPGSQQSDSGQSRQSTGGQR